MSLLDERPLSSAVVALRLRAHESVNWEPGQHVWLFTESGPEGGTPYSIASARTAERPNEFEIAVSTEGGEALLAQVRARETLWISDPRGRFVWSPQGESTLLVGMGTGVAPLRAMLQAALASEEPKPVRLLFGARGEDDLLFRSEFSALEAQFARFRFLPTLSRPPQGFRGWNGRVQLHLAAALEGLRDVAVYVCGNRAMVSDCVARLASEYAVDPLRIQSEAH